MAIRVTHSISAGGVVDPTATVDGAAWDAPHVQTGDFFSETSATGGTRSFTAEDKHFLVKRSNATAAMIDTLPGTAVLASGWRTCICNTDAAALLAVTVASGTTLDGIASGVLYLGPGQSAVIASDGVRYCTESKPALAKLSDVTTIYFGSGGASTNTGLTIANCFATLQQAYDAAANNFNCNKQAVHIKFASDQTVTAGLLTNRAIAGQDGPSGVVIEGVTAAGSIISVTNNDCIALGTGVFSTAQITLKNITLQTATSGSAVVAYAGGVVIDGVRFGTCATYHISAGHGAFIIYGGTGYSVVGNATIHLVAATAGTIAIHNSTITFSNSPVFSIFAYAEGGGAIYAANTTFTNGATVTGARYNVVTNAVINTSQASLTYLPGSTAGSSASGGRHDALLQTSLAEGGTNANLTAAAGGMPYSTASAIALTAAGTAGQAMMSNGASAPAFAPLRQAFTLNGAGGFAAGATGYMLGAGSATELVVSASVPMAGTLKNLYVSLSAAPGAGQTVIATLRVNGLDTGVTCTIADSATSASDLTHTAAITAGQLWSVKTVYSAGAASSVPKGAIEFDNP